MKPVLILLLFSVACADNVRDFIEQLRDDFWSVERGESSSLNVQFRYLHGQQKFDIDYQFWTRNQTERKWASTLAITEILAHNPHFNRLTYKSVYDDGKLYLNIKNFYRNVEFLESLLTQGPQIYSLIDEWMQQEGNEDVKHGMSTQYRKEMIPGVRYLDLTRYESERYVVHYRHDEETEIVTSPIQFHTYESFDDSVFKTADMHLVERFSDLKPLPYYLKTGLFLGFWNFVKTSQ